MGRVIVNNYSDTLSDAEAVQYVLRVMRDGRISNGGRQYCYATTFAGVEDEISIVVASELNKASDSFFVYEDRTPQRDASEPAR